VIQPFNDKVLVRRVAPEDRTAGGIIIPDAHQKELDQGIVVAVGPGRRMGEHLAPVEAKVGDHIVYGRYAGKEVEQGGEKYLLMSEGDLLGKVVEATAEVTRPVVLGHPH